MTGHWEHFTHEADIGVRGIGNTMAEAFAQAALALTAVITDPGHVSLREETIINCEAPDSELLLVDWLNALIYETATRNMLFSQFEVNITGTHLRASCRGEPLDPERHQPVVEIKGATYTELAVRKENGHWLAQTVVDV